MEQCLLSAESSIAKHSQAEADKSPFGDTKDGIST